MFEQVVERQQPPQHDLRRGGPAMPDVLDPEHPVDAPRRDAAEPEPGAVPRLLDRVLAAPANEAVGERRIGPADEGEVPASGNDFVNTDGMNIVVFQRSNGTWSTRITDRSSRAKKYSRRTYESKDAAKLGV